MRLRNLKNKSDILNNCSFLIKDNSCKNNWNYIFDNNNPIHIEIGMGMGKFIYEHALRYPNINFIGIEKFDNVLARAVKNMDELSNLKVIRMDAKNIEEYFGREVDTIYLNFSDPWPKKRNARRRLTSESFLPLYENISKNKANIIQKTDNRDLFIYSIESFNNSGYKLFNISFNLHENQDDIITTEYEEKFLNKGNNIYYLEAQKKL